MQLIIWRDMRKNNGGNPQRTPRSKSNAFPHRVDILIGRIVDLNLLSLFPQEYAGIKGGRGRGNY
jgi:hypothetical protein